MSKVHLLERFDACLSYICARVEFVSWFVYGFTYERRFKCVFAYLLSMTLYDSHDVNIQLQTDDTLVNNFIIWSFPFQAPITLSSSCVNQIRNTVG